MHPIALTEYNRIRTKDPTYPASAALLYAKQWAEIHELEQKYDVTLEADFDHIPVRGNAMGSGDDEYDKQVEDEIIRRLDNGDVWAWAAVTVRVQHEGFEEEDHLGCCSYKDATDFRKGGYYYDMVTSCVERIEEQLAERRGVEAFAEEVAHAE